MKPFRHVLDFVNRKAIVPGDGTQKVSFLHSRDLSRYVAAIVEDERGEWPEVSAFVAGVMSWGEMVEVAERVTGKSYIFSLIVSFLERELTFYRREVGC